MLRSFSNKAISSKARAMYGRRLSAGDYDELVKKRSVGEIASFLRDGTHYREVLGSVDSSIIHRGQLEHFLRSLRYLQYRRLIAYDFGAGEIYRYLYLRDEIQQLLSLLRYLSGRGQGQAGERYDFHFDSSLPEHTSYDLLKLVTLKSYRELLDFLGESPYGRILRRFPPDPSGQIDLMGCERELAVWYYRHMLDLAGRGSAGEREALRRMVLARVDDENISRAYRLKRFFRRDQDFILQNLLPFPSPSARLIRRMAGAQSVTELHGILREAKLIPQEADPEEDFIENIILRARDKRSKQNLRNSPHPPVVLEAYMTQTEIELENVIHIIESVRYGLPPNEIRRMLIL